MASHKQNSPLQEEAIDRSQEALQARVHELEAELATLRENSNHTQRRRANVIDAVSLGTFEWSLDEPRAHFLSDMAYRVLGYEPGAVAVTANFLKSALHPEDLSAAQDALWAGTAAAKTCTHVARVKTAAGDYRYIELHALTSTVPDGTRQLTGGIRDVDTAKRLELDNKRISDRLRTVIEAANTTAWEWPDVRGSYIEMDGDFLERMGIPGPHPETVAHFFAHVHPDFLQDVQAAMTQVLQHGGTTAVEYQIGRADTGYRWVRSTATAFLDDSGAGAHRLVGSSADVHDRKTAELTLARAGEQRKHFNYLLAHDLTAPLRHINAFSEILCEEYADRLDAEGQQFVRIIQEASQRATDTIAALLKYAESDRHEPHYGTVDLASLIKSTVEVLSLKPGADRVQWSIGDLPTVEADESQLRLLFQNLLDNAIKFTREEATPRIEVRAAGDAPEGRVAIEIVDNGIGISATQSQRIFGMFQRGRHEVSYEGMGIGLAHAARIVERHGGTITASGELGVGAVVRVEL